MRIQHVGFLFAVVGAVACAGPNRVQAQVQKDTAPGQTTLSIAQGADLSERALEILNQRCTVCHGAERFEARHFAPEEWNRVIDRMVGLGASLSGDEREALRHWSNAK